MKEVVDVAALNSRIKFDRTDVPFDQRTILGDATETGLIRFAGRQLPEDYEAYTSQYPKVFEGKFYLFLELAQLNAASLVPFNSTNKWALSIVSITSLNVSILSADTQSRLINLTTMES